MAAARVRRVLRDIHLWIGVCLVILFIPLGLTGSFMVFEDSFDRMLHPHRYEISGGEPTLPASQYLASAQKAFGARSHVAFLRMPDDEGAAVIVTGSGGETAWLDPGSARVRDVGNPRTELRALAHQFHENLFMPPRGRRIIGVLGGLMFVSAVTGLITWWPRNNAVLKGLRWRRSPLVWSNLHHLVGFWASAFLAILSATGVLLAYPEILRPVRTAAPREARFEGGPRAFFFAPPLASPRLSPDQALAAAEKAAGASDYASLRLPTQGGEPNWQAMVLGDNGPSFVAVDDNTGQAHVLRGRGGGRFGGGFDRERRPPAMRIVRMLHAGDDASIVWRVLIFIAGLAPTVLGITGVVIWLRSRRRPDLLGSER